MTGTEFVVLCGKSCCSGLDFSHACLCVKLVTVSGAVLHVLLLITAVRARNALQDNPDEPMGPQVSEQAAAHRLQPRSPNLDADDDKSDYPDDSSVSSAEADENGPAGVQMVDGVHLPSSDRYMQTSHPIAIDGNTQAHVVVSSRQPIPDDVPVVVVAPSNPSPFAASNLQTRSSSFASD